MSLLLKKINGGLRMFKKIVLIGLLIMLLSSVVYAPEYTINTEKAPTIITIEKTIDEISMITTEDLWVWLEVPEQLPPPGPKQTFLVDLYITLYKPTLEKTLTLKLKPSNSKVKFTGGVQDLGAYTYIFSKDKWSNVYANPSDGSILLSRLFNSVSGISTFKKLFVARLEMLVTESGSFQILLVGDESEAWYDSSNEYALKQGNTRVIRNTQCIPNVNSVACSNKCGNVDNGCGKIVSCGNTCTSGQVCSTNNVCVDALNLALPNPSDKELCEAVIKVSIKDVNARDVLKGTSNALRGNNIDGKPLECSSFGCKYYILNVINDVLTTWFGNQQ